MKTTPFLIILATLFLSVPTWAWDGYDYEKGSFVEIEKGSLVRSGRDIEIFDYDDAGYIDVEVQSIQRFGGTVEIEVYDYESGEYRTLDMDDD